LAGNTSFSEKKKKKKKIGPKTTSKDSSDEIEGVMERQEVAGKGGKGRTGGWSCRG